VAKAETLEGFYMRAANLGDRVRIQYSRVRESSAALNHAPPAKTCEFTVGSNEVVRSLSLGVIGMAPGDRKQLTLQPQEGYGPVKAKLIRQIPRQRFPQHLALEVGKRMTAFVASSGRRQRVRIIAIHADTVTVDGNHPLAGKIIELEVNLISLDSSSTANKQNPQFDLGGQG
jgi:FKBP-type peptidyl-prolyl cis-trans isomerase 2